MAMMKVREVAQKDLSRIRDEDWVDWSRRPFVRGTVAYVPVRDGFPFSSILPDPRPYRGRGYTMIGTIAVFHGKEMPRDADVRAVEVSRNPTAVLWIPSCEGQRRKPRAHVLAGTPGEVVHRECGITYFLDPSRIMFSAGNRGEKERLRKMVRPGERVADMFAGIGYFSLPVALAGARVHAMEIDPGAFSFLVRNIRANGVADRVFPQLGDCRSCLSGTYDRIIMGHFDSCRYLDRALSHVREGSVLHVHTAGDASGPLEKILAERGTHATVETHRVKKLGPHIWHCVQDVTIG
ncbi:MAG: SAM-dependent methyltransferase [Methanolinea sp.]|nr:SAM-dependent methyltransferase [Methanolinea sp.]